MFPTMVEKYVESQGDYFEGFQRSRYACFFFLPCPKVRYFSNRPGMRSEKEDVIHKTYPEVGQNERNPV
jgi:hypothetical protein